LDPTYGDHETGYTTTNIEFSHSIDQAFRCLSWLARRGRRGRGRRALADRVGFLNRYDSESFRALA